MSCREVEALKLVNSDSRNDDYNIRSFTGKKKPNLSLVSFFFFFLSRSEKERLSQFSAKEEDNVY